MTAAELITALRQCKPTAPVTVYVPDAEEPAIQYGFRDFAVRPGWTVKTTKQATDVGIVLPRSKARAESYFELVNALVFIDEAVIDGHLNAQEVAERFADARALITGVRA